MKTLRQNSSGLQKLYDRNLYARKKHIEEKVRHIIDDVRANGDDALVKYTKRFDKAKLTTRQIHVVENEISGAFQNITSEFIAALKTIISNVTVFYRKQLAHPCRIRDIDGVMLKERIEPVESVGIYIPAGTAPLVSTIYMTVIPARIAGVKRIVIATPPDKNGHINPYILAVANLLNVNEIYKVGGAQAIAALAFGTKTIARVDKIIGPGNMYVTEAKRQLFGYVDIDMLAGPTEIVIIANRHSNIEYVIADLEAQLEHVGGIAILVTTSKQLGKIARQRVPKGFVIFAKNTDEAIEVANKIAPEHIQIMTNNPVKIGNKIRNAGAIFLGQYSPASVGDYVAGPSHVLPTLGTARFFSSLSLTSFLKTSHVISYTRKALEKTLAPLEKVATIEGLIKHFESARIRFDQKGS